MRSSRISSLLAAALVLAAVPARAQNASLDSRWTSYLGCWQSVGLKVTTVCLLPVGGGESAVDLVTIDSGVVTSAERIVAGQRVSTTHGECMGWQIAEWSTVSDRLYLQSEETCPGAGTRTATGLITLSHDGSLLYIQGGAIRRKTGVQALRYSEGTNQELPSEVRDARDAIRTDFTTRARAHATAVARIAVEDVTEASRHLEPDVVEAWLMERGGPITVDAERLVAMANAGVPSSTIDVLVALAYPNVFAINGRHAQAQLGDYAAPTFGTLDACDLDYGYDYGYGSPYCGGFGGYGYGYPGFYPGYGYPYVIVYTGSGSGGAVDAHRHGRVVNGKGYQEGQGSTPDVSRPGQPRSDGFGSNSGSTGTRTSTPSTSSSGGSTEQRTAKPRP